MRRQVQFSKPYDKVIKEKQVQRLKSDLKSAKATLRSNVAVIKQDEAGPNLQGLTVVDQTLKYTNEIQIERRKLHEENKKLQEQLSAMK